MSETTTAPAATETPAQAPAATPAPVETQPAAQPKKAPAKKAAPKKAPAKKSPAKKATKAKAKAERNGAPRAKKDGLRKPQLRILSALKKSSRPMTRTDIAKKAPVDQAACVEYIGSHDPDVRKANDSKHFPSLITLGLVKAEQHDVDGRDTVMYSLTAKGRQALEKASA